MHSISKAARRWSRAARADSASPWRALGEMGAKVIISARKADELDAAVASLKKRGVPAVRVVGDLSRAENT